MIAGVSELPGTVTLSPIFSDGMVLQAGEDIPVWGSASPGERVTLSFAGQVVTTVASATGEWSVKFHSMSVKPHAGSMIVRGTNVMEIGNIAVGEVWLASGQSNMAFPFAQEGTGPIPPIFAATISEPTDPDIRIFNLERADGETQGDIKRETYKGRWEISSADSRRRFSIVAYYFARALEKHLNIPVGVIVSAVGGTAAEVWTPPWALRNRSDLKELIGRGKKGVWPFLSGEFYERLILPISKFPVKGIIWYQGESNSGRGAEYRSLLPAMIAAWRKDRNQEELPFLFVQLPPFDDLAMAQPWEPLGVQSDPEVREAQLLTAKRVSKTAMVVTIDLCDGHDLHPLNKLPVGERLALCARALAYHERIEYSGPIIERWRVSNGAILIWFSHAKSGLDIRGQSTSEFSVAGEDGIFYPAEARIQNGHLEVRSAEVSHPTAARYAWARAPAGILFNRDGLPASPFRTDGQ